MRMVERLKLCGDIRRGTSPYFTGDVVSYQDRYDGDIGWIREYRALGLRNRADWIPVTDSNTLTDSVRYNMPANNLNTICPARAGTWVRPFSIS